MSTNLTSPIKPSYRKGMDAYPASRRASRARRWKKRSYTRHYRRAFAYQLRTGLEALSDFQPSEIWAN